MTTFFEDIASDPGLVFLPATALAVCTQCNSAFDALTQISVGAQRLTDTGSAGTFKSATSIQERLTVLGGFCATAVGGLTNNVEDFGDAVREAGRRLTSQDEENAYKVRCAEFASGYPAIGQPSSGATNCQPNDPGPSTDNLGPFPCSAPVETPPGGGVVDWGFLNSKDANNEKLTALVENWMTVARDIAATIAAFRAGVDAIMNSNLWTGTAADGVRAGANHYVNVGTRLSEDAFANGMTVSGWVAAVFTTKSGFESLNNQKGISDFAYRTAVPMNPGAIQIHQAEMRALDQAGRDLMNNTYTPSSIATSRGLRNLPDPSSPVGTLVALRAPGSKPASTNGGAPPFGSGGGSGGGGGGGGDEASAVAAANKAAPDPAKTLARHGDGDPVPAAAQNTSTQNGQANPASVAQPAAANRGDSASSLTGSRTDPSATKLSSMNSIAEAEKAAAAKAAASALSKGGPGGGGLGGAGLGAGGLGGAGAAAAAEGSLSARSVAGLSAAERAAAAPQAAPATGRAGTTGAPMSGARGASGEQDKEHKSARYLISAENGDEIAGELPDTAPAVFGGLNMDVRDNPEPPAER